MNQSNRRKTFRDIKIKFLFAVYIIFTFSAILIVFGDILLKTLFSLFSPDFAAGIPSLSTNGQFFIFFVWTIYGFFLSYIYASSKIDGLIFRLAKVFDKLAEGNSLKLSFRENDAFHPVSESFNKMMEKFIFKENIKNRLKQAAEQADDKTKKNLEILIKELSL